MFCGTWHTFVHKLGGLKAQILRSDLSQDWGSNFDFGNEKAPCRSDMGLRGGDSKEFEANL